MTDKTKRPTEREMVDFIGNLERTRAWSDTREFIETRYDVKPELNFGGAKYRLGDPLPQRW